MRNKKIGVRYFRLHAVGDGGDEVQIGDIPFPELVQKLGGRSADDRTLTVSGSRYLVESRAGFSSALVLHKIKGDGEWLSLIDAQGVVTEIMAIDEDGNSFADTSCVVFLGNNSFAIARGNSGAPTANRVADWLTELRPLNNDLRYTATPLMADAEIAELQAADGAKKLVIEADIEVIRDMGVSLWDDSREAAGLAGGATVTLSISYGRGNPTPDQAKSLLWRVKHLIPDLGSVRKARVTSVRTVEGKRKRPRLVTDVLDLLSSNLATEFTVPLDGSGVTIEATLSGIERANQQFMPKITRAWEMGDDGATEALGR